MHRDFQGECIYQAELDTHFPKLTVRQTLAFAVEARASRTLLPGVTRRRYIEFMSNAVMAIFKLGQQYEWT